MSNIVNKTYFDLKFVNQRVELVDCPQKPSSTEVVLGKIERVIKEGIFPATSTLSTLQMSHVESLILQEESNRDLFLWKLYLKLTDLKKGYLAKRRTLSFNVLRNLSINFGFFPYLFPTEMKIEKLQNKLRQLAIQTSQFTRIGSNASSIIASFLPLKDLVAFSKTCKFGKKLYPRALTLKAKAIGFKQNDTKKALNYYKSAFLGMQVIAKRISDPTFTRFSSEQKLLHVYRQKRHFRGHLESFLFHFSSQKSKESLLALKALIIFRTNVNTRNYSTMETPLLVAAKNGNSDAVDLLLKNRADSVVSVSSGTTVLMYASQQIKKIATFEKLLTSHANATLQTKDQLGNNALIYAIQGKSIGNAKRLIAKGINVNSANNAAETPLIWACRLDLLGMTRLLLTNGADAMINHRDARGYTALHYAATTNDYRLVKLLIESGADPSIHTRAGTHVVNLTSNDAIILRLEGRLPW
jgi:ankyrin repeat protein